jgi:hypothetical protein
MKPILDAIWGFIKRAFSKEKLPITLGVICLILMAGLMKSCNDLHNEKEARKADAVMSENNLKAMTDSLTTYYNKEMDRMVTEKTSYVVNKIGDLEKYNKALFDEMKAVKNSVAGIKSDVGIMIPTLNSINGKIISDPKDSTKFTLPFEFNYADAGLTQHLAGNSRIQILNNKPQLPILSTLTTNTMDVKLSYNYREEKGKYIVSASSPSKLVKFTELDGALVLDKIPQSTTKKCSRWNLSAGAMFGLNTDIALKNPRFGWGGGLVLGYDLIK